VRPNSLLILFIVMMTCAAVAVGETLRVAGITTWSPLFLGVLGAAATWWFRPRWLAYRKHWEARRS
jgi:hypothetical protein